MFRRAFISQPMVRSTFQRRGRMTEPFAPRGRDGSQGEPEALVGPVDELAGESRPRLSDLRLGESQAPEQIAGCVPCSASRPRARGDGPYIAQCRRRNQHRRPAPDSRRQQGGVVQQHRLCLTRRSGYRRCIHCRRASSSPPLHFGSVQRRTVSAEAYYSSRSIWFSLILSSLRVASFWTA